MDKKGVDGQISIIILIAIFIFASAALYPFFKSTLSWFSSLNFLFKIALVITGLLTLYIIFNKMQPESAI